MSTDGGVLTEQEIDIVNGVSTAVSALSVMGSWSIVFAYWRFKHLRKFAMKLVLMLSLSDIGNQIADFIQPTAAEFASMEAGGPIVPTCYTQAILDSFFELASVTWTSAIAATLFLSVFQRKSTEDVSRRFPIFCAVCYGMPAVLALLPLIDNSYGPSGAWCWISSNIESTRQHLWRAFQFYVPLWLCITFNSVVYVRVLRLLHKTLKASGPSDATAATIRKFMARLQYYPFILVVVWLWATINRIYEFASGGKQIFWLYLLQRVFSSSQGLLNALAYGLTSEGIKDAIQDDLAALFPSCCGHLGAARRARGGAGVLEDSGVVMGKSPGGGAGTGAGVGGNAPPNDEDTLAAAHGVYSGSSSSSSSSASSSSATSGIARSSDHEASWARLNAAGAAENGGRVDDRAIPIGGGGQAGVSVVPNPLSAATTGQGSLPPPPPPVPVSREDRVRALQQAR